jgi:hypothetical protein
MDKTPVTVRAHRGRNCSWAKIQRHTILLLSGHGSDVMWKGTFEHASHTVLRGQYIYIIPRKRWRKRLHNWDSRKKLRKGKRLWFWNGWRAWSRVGLGSGRPWPDPDPNRVRVRVNFWWPCLGSGSIFLTRPGPTLADPAGSYEVPL